MNITELDSYNLADAVKFNDTLNPAIWVGEKMKPEVRERLLVIAQDFKEFLGLSDLEVKDITVSGSNAGYTYTPHSDIDLHLVVDIPQADESDVYRELFDAKKYQYNDQHNITIGGYDVELYVEDARKQPVSQGIYSVLNNDWVKIPRKIRATVNDEAVKSKFEDVGHRIESAVAAGNAEAIAELSQKIKNMRQAGLDAHGELGPENLAYKMLRNQGMIKKLYDARTAAQDAELSLNERKKKKAQKKKTKYGYGGYFYPGYSFNTDTDASVADAGGDGGESMREAEPSTEDTVTDFVAFCVDKLSIENNPQIRFKRDPAWSARNKTFGSYNHDTNELIVSLANRHVMDILRTVAHELTHQRQGEVADIPDHAGETGSRWENEANARAGVLMREYGQKHPALFAEQPVVDEGWKEKAAGLAAAACIAGTPGCATTTAGAVRDAQTVARTAQSVKNMSRAGVKAELDQELRNFIQAQGQGPGSANAKNQSRLYQLQKKAQQNEARGSSNLNKLHKPAEYKKALKAFALLNMVSDEEAVAYLAQYSDTVDALIANGGTVYRALWMEPGKKPNLKDPGKHWTISVENAEEYLDSNAGMDAYSDINELGVKPVPVIIAATVGPNNITNRDVLIAQFPDEQEVSIINPKQAKYKVVKAQNINEASGYIPTKKQAKLPQFSNALSVDVHPGQIGKEANKMGLETDSQGHPQLLIKNLKNALREFKETGWLKEKYHPPISQVPGSIEDDLGNQEATGPEFPPQMPAGTTKIDVTDLTDWYRLGQDISDMDDADPEDYNQGPPQTVVVFPSDELEQPYLKQFKRLGLKTHDMDPDVKGGEDIEGKHLKEEQLDEVKMSPGALRKFAASPEAEGIMAGFEAELIFRDTQHDDDDDDMEADMDADERARSISDVIEFFSNDEYGYGLSERQASRLQDQLDEAYFEWRDDQIIDAFNREAEDLIREQWLEERPMVERIHSALTDGMGLDDAEADRIIAAGDKAPRFTKHEDQIDYKEENPEYAQYLEAADIADTILDEEVEASLENQDGYYDAALDEFRDNYDEDDSDFFTDMGWRWMSDIMNEFNLDWPYYTGSGGSYGSRSWDDIADNLSATLGMPVKVGYGYHSAPRKPGQYVLEPDSSLNPDDSEDYGLELVSPPMPLNQAIEQLNAVVDWANDEGDAYTNSSTGLHMGVSIPYKGGDVDYLKLITFLGDQYVLEKFGRAANTYCDSALKKLKQNVAGSKNRGDDKIASAMELMKHGLIELAQKYVQQGVGSSKYTSAHIKPGYIEFRSPGGDYLSQSNRDIGALEDTMRRFAYAMYLAGRPDLERKEYYKKLYKLIAPEGNKDLEMFAKYSSGEITAEELKKQWAEKVIAKEVPLAGKEKGNWVLYNNETQKPVPGATFGNYSEIDAWERAKAKVSPDSSMEDFKRAYTLADDSKNTGQWDVVERGTEKLVDTIEAPNRGAAADLAYDKKYDEDWYIRPHVEFAQPEKPEPKLSRRAQLAKQIAQPADYVIVNKHSGLPFYTFRASSQSQAVDFGVTYLRDKGLDLDNFSVQKASNVKQAVDNRADSKQLQQRLDVKNWHFYRTDTGELVDRLSDANQMQAEAVRKDWVRRYNLNDDQVIMSPVSSADQYEIVDRRTGQVVLQYRAADADDAGDGFNNWLRNQGMPLDTENYGYRPAQTNANPGAEQRAQNIRANAPRADFEVYDSSNNDRVIARLDNVTADQVRDAIRSYESEAGGYASGVLRVRQVQAQPEQVRMPNGVPVWELYDLATGSVLNAFADHNMREAYHQGMRWLSSIGAEDPDTYGDRFAVRAKMLQPGERNLGETFNRDQKIQTQLALDTLSQKAGFKNFAAVPQGNVRIKIMQQAVKLLQKNIL